MENLIVKKFGGTSLADVERVKRAADIVYEDVKKGLKVIVVVSAPSGFTDSIIRECEFIKLDVRNSAHDIRMLNEIDVSMSAGEQINCGLLALELLSRGIKAASWLSWQIPIYAESPYNGRHIKLIKLDALSGFFKNNDVAVVAGFQGINHEGRLVTLGRGGSDTTAVAMAAAFKVECEIYTDVEGVYTVDPRLVPNAKIIPAIRYDDMLELAVLGAKVLHFSCVELAARYKVLVKIKSSFCPNSNGTIMTDQYDFYANPVSGVACSKGEAAVSLEGEGLLIAEIFRLIASKGIIVDMISIGIDHKSVTFSLKSSELITASAILEANKDKIRYHSILQKDHLYKISVVGSGMVACHGVAARIFSVLEDNAINMLGVTTSEMKVTVLVSADDGEKAVRLLHCEFFNKQED